MKPVAKNHKYEERDFVNVDDPAGLDCSVLPSRALQEFAKEVDINTIAERYRLTGELPENVPMLQQGDFAEGVTDFQTAMNLIVAARESFGAMPAEVRARFDNDAQKFLDFTSDPANFDVAAKLGLVRPEVIAARAAEAEAQRKAELDAAVAAKLAASSVEPPKAS